MRSLTHVSVDGLLGQFRHEIYFPAEWDFCILYGPNGIGKTKILELIEAIFELNEFEVSRIPFDSAKLVFSDSSTVELTRVRSKNNRLKISVRLTTPTGEYSWNLNEEIGRHSPKILRQLQEFAPIRRIGKDSWRDLSSGETLNRHELVRKYSDVIDVDLDMSEQSIPPEAKRFFDSLYVDLIETQRLLQFNEDWDSRHFSGRPTEGRMSTQRQKPTVVELAEDLTARLNRAMAENSRVSQGLDRDFPRKILNESGGLKNITEEKIRERYNSQLELRKSLAEIAVLDSLPDIPLPDRALHDWELRVLWTYLDDAETKLKTFSDLLEKVILLRNIVNDRFSFKKMIIDRDKGFRFATDTNHEIDANYLSSGEQHELVMCYNLLFKARKSSLVLIDEPEISLHVAWQQEYINDIRRISKISGLRFLIATHSPQVIHNWWDRAISLDPFKGDGA